MGLWLMKITQGPSQSNLAVKRRNVSRPKKKDPQYLKVHVGPEKSFWASPSNFKLKQTRFDSIEHGKEPEKDTCGR